MTNRLTIIMLTREMVMLLERTQPHSRQLTDNMEKQQFYVEAYIGLGPEPPDSLELPLDQFSERWLAPCAKILRRAIGEDGVVSGELLQILTESNFSYASEHYNSCAVRGILALIADDSRARENGVERASWVLRFDVLAYVRA